MNASPLTNQRENVRPRPAPPLPTVTGPMLPGSAPTLQSAKLDGSSRLKRTDAPQLVDQQPVKKPKLEASNASLAVVAAVAVPAAAPVASAVKPCAPLQDLAHQRVQVQVAAACTASPSTKATPSPTLIDERTDGASSMPVMKVNQRPVHPERTNTNARPLSPPRSSPSSSLSSSPSPSKADDIPMRQHIYKPKVDTSSAVAVAPDDQPGETQPMLQTRQEMAGGSVRNHPWQPKPRTNPTALNEKDAQQPPDNISTNNNNNDDMQIESDSSRIDDNVDDSNNKHANQQQRRLWPALEVFEFHGRHRELWSLLGDIFGEQSVGMLMKSLMDALKEGSSVSRRKARGPGFCSRIIDLLKHYYENVNSSPDEYELSALFVKAYAEDVSVTMRQVRNYFRQKRAYENRIKAKK